PLYDNARVQVPDAEADQRPSGPGARRLSRTVQENGTAPGQRGDERLNDSTAATMPASLTDSTAAGAATRAAAPTTIGTSSGQYVIVGGVVGEVNGTPIYAGKVLSLIEPVLAARAKDLDPQQFRGIAPRE